MIRLLAALLLAPGLGVAIGAAVVLQVHGRLDDWWVYMLVGCYVSYPIALVLGLPAYLVLKRITTVQLWHAAIAGILFAIPGWLMLGQAPNSPIQETQEAFNLILMGASGLVAAVLFWFLVCWPMRPNRPMQPTAASGG